MAKAAASKVGSTSRIRFIMLDAEVSDGDLNQVTQAIQNALRPPAVSSSTKTALTASQRLLPTNDLVPSQPTEDDASMDEGDDLELETPSSHQPRVAPKGPRKFRTPQVLTDVDLNSPMSFADFAKERNPSSDRKKYLTVAAWFKEHRGVEAIGADHVYTCFRAIKWNTNIEDFQSPLRALKSQQLMNGAGRGLFAINHLGIAEVDKLD